MAMMVTHKLRCLSVRGWLVFLFLTQIHLTVPWLLNLRTALHLFYHVMHRVFRPVRNHGNVEVSNLEHHVTNDKRIAWKI